MAGISQIVKDKSRLERCNVIQCCCFFTLRAGSLIIGVLELILGIAWFIGGGAEGGGAFSSFLSALCMLLAGAFVLWSIYKGNIKFLWWAIYINIFIGFWLLISAIIMFCTFRVGLAIGALINMVVVFYFVAVLRSYAFELGTATMEIPPPV